MTTWVSLLDSQLLQIDEAIGANPGLLPSDPLVRRYPTGILEFRNLPDLTINVAPVALPRANAKSLYPLVATYLRIDVQGTFGAGDSLALVASDGDILATHSILASYTDYTTVLIPVLRSTWDSTLDSYGSSGPLFGLKIVTAAAGGLLIQDIMLSDDYIGELTVVHSESLTIPEGLEASATWYEQKQEILDSQGQESFANTRGTHAYGIVDSETGRPSVPAGFCFLGGVSEDTLAYLTHWVVSWTPGNNLLADAASEYTSEIFPQGVGFVSLPQGQHVWLDDVSVFVGWEVKDFQESSHQWGEYRDENAFPAALFGPYETMLATSGGAGGGGGGGATTAYTVALEDLISYPELDAADEASMFALYAGTTDPLSDPPGTDAVMANGYIQATWGWKHTGALTPGDLAVPGFLYDPAGGGNYLAVDRMVEFEAGSRDFLTFNYYGQVSPSVWKDTNILVESYMNTSSTTQRSFSSPHSFRLEQHGTDPNKIRTLMMADDNVAIESLMILWPNLPVITVRHRFMNLRDYPIQRIAGARQLASTMDQQLAYIWNPNHTAGFSHGAYVEGLVWITAPISNHLMAMFTTTNFVNAQGMGRTNGGDPDAVLWGWFSDETDTGMPTMHQAVLVENLPSKAFFDYTYHIICCESLACLDEILPAIVASGAPSMADGTTIGDIEYKAQLDHPTDGAIEYSLKQTTKVSGIPEDPDVVGAGGGGGGGSGNASSPYVGGGSAPPTTYNWLNPFSGLTTTLTRWGNYD